MNEKQNLIEQCKIKQAIIKKMLVGRITLLDMINKTFPEVHGQAYRQAWFHEIIAEELELWDTDEDYPNLIVEIPPRHGKSEIVSRGLPAYLFGKNPNTRVISTSYGQDLQNDMSLDVQRIMMTDAYKEMFPYTRLSEVGSRQVTKRRLTSHFDVIGGSGAYVGRGVGGGITGRGADRIIIDDPVKNRAEAESMTVRDSIWSWYTSTLRTRLQKGGKIVLLMTRWHEDDLAGRLIEQLKKEPDGDQWRVISFPALFDSKNENCHEKDFREEGTALWEDEFSTETLNKTRNSIVSYDWYSLFQQQPVPAGGAIIKRTWFNIIGIEDAPKDLFWLRFWDLAVTKKTSSDFTASVMLSIDKSMNVYLKRIIRKRAEWPEIKQLMIRTAIFEAVPVGIEQAGTQVGFIQDLLAEPKLAKIAVKGYTVQADKLTRALPWIARLEQGKFFIIDGTGVDELITELVKFTGHEDLHDDQVDAISGAYKMLADYVQAEVEYLGQYEY